MVKAVTSVWTMSLAKFEIAAGITRSRRATLATRDRRDFDGLGLRLVDPWVGDR
jgi:hypothetical protein